MHKITLQIPAIGKIASIDIETKNCLFYTFGLLFFLIVLPPVNADSTTTETFVANTAQTINAVVVENFPPHYSLDKNGEPQGFAIDVMNEIAEIANFKINYIVKKNWTETANTLRQGKADLIPNLGISKIRQESFDFTQAVEIFPISIIIRTETHDIKSAQQLANKMVGVVKFNVGAKIVQDLDNIKVKIYDQPENALFALLSGQISAIVYPKSVMLKVAREIGLEHRIKIAGKPLKEIKRAVAVRKGNTALLHRLNGVIEQFALSDKYKEIYAKWYGKPKPFWTVTKVVIVSASLIVIILIISGIWRYQTITAINKRLLKTIAELKQAEDALAKSEEQVRLLLDSTAEAIFGIDSSGQCTFVNQACLNMLGYTHGSELIGKNMHQLIQHSLADGSNYPETSSPFYQTFQHENESHIDDEVFWRKDGSCFAAEYWAHPILKHNLCIGAVVTFLDITDRIQANKALQEREQDLAITLNSIGDAVITTDAKGNVTRMNPIAEKLTGWKLQDARGLAVKTIFPIINATTRKPVANPVEKVLATGETIHLSNHTTLVAKDGTEYHIADSAAPIRNGDDHIQGMVLVFNDVTEQYRLREKIRSNQRLMQGLMDDLKSMVGIMQPDGCIEFINSTPLDLTGIEKQHVMGKYLWECDWFAMISGNAERIRSQCQRVARGATETQDIQFQTKEGIVWLELGIYPVLDEHGNIIQMVFEGVDISQRKKTEELQKNYQLELQQQVQQRTAELEQKAAELARATHLKSEFLANMSHELRTPMNSIIGFTGRVIKKSADLLDVKQLNNLRTVERNAHHLLGLINGLLDLSKIEAGKMEAHATRFDFSSLVREVFNLTQPMILENKSIVFKTDLPAEGIELYTDQIKLKQVLINLVSNAIKFTQTGSITINAEYLPNEDLEAVSQIAIRVTDTGVGMDKDALGYIFDAFRQIDGSITRKVGGTGLGLAIVNNFVKLLQGTIRVISAPGVGTCFEIHIPTKLAVFDFEPESEQHISFPSQIKDGEKQTIICIDDEAEVLDLLREYLCDEGFHVVTARTAERGLELAKQLRPLAITLDILMPSTDGWSVLNELKSNEQTRDIPVIVVSFIDNQKLGYQLGAFDFLQKPVNPQRLISSIRRLMYGNINKALVVDDEAGARELMRQILDDAQISCDVAVDGNDALLHLEHAGEQLPQIIILDLMMPGMDGFELLQKMQQNPTWQQIPVIVVTAKTLAEHEFEFLRPRVACILAKQGLSSEQVLTQLTKTIKQIQQTNLAPKPRKIETPEMELTD